MKARQTFDQPYDCACDWPTGILLQCGSRGLVVGNPSYTTAFFEAFPKLPPDAQFEFEGQAIEVIDRNIFLRGEGPTIADAEAACFARWQRVCACELHELERRDRTDGYAFCKKCRVSGMWLQPTTHCATCGVPAAYGTDRHGATYCQACWSLVPSEQWPSSLRKLHDLMQ